MSDLQQFKILKASNDYLTMVQFSEKCLTKLGHHYARNGNDTVSEFEMNDSHFRVVVEPSKIPITRNFPVRTLSSPKGSTVEIRFDVDIQSQELENAITEARRFVGCLIEDLPVKPWVGLGGFFNREEKKWRKFLGT